MGNKTGHGSIRVRKQKLKDVERNKTSVSNFLKEELKISNQTTDENFLDEWANWRIGPKGQDIYKIGDPKKTLDYIDDLLKDPEYRKMLSNNDIDDLINTKEIDDTDINENLILDDDAIRDDVIRENPPRPDGEEGGGGRNAGVGNKDDTRKNAKPKTEIPTAGVGNKNDTRKNAEPVTEMPKAGAASVLSTTPNTDSYPPMGISKQKVVESKGDVSFTGVDQIPESRLNTDNKSQEELRADIRYFFSNFPKPLRNLKSQARNLNQMGLVQLQRLHKRIVNVLQPNKIQMRGKKVGVVIDAEEYIKQKVGEVMISNAIKGYEIPNLQPLTTENKNENEEEDVKDIGSYEVKRGPDGGLNAQKEPVYRFIPTTNEEELEEISYDYESKRKPKRMKLPKTKMRNQVVTGKRQVSSNPFLKKQGGHRLNVLL